MYGTMFPLGAILLQLLTSFGRLNALEMPLELVHDNLNIPKSGDYGRHIVFPSQTDVPVEMPSNIEDDFEFTTKGIDSEDRDYTDEESAPRAAMPRWLELHQTTHQHQPEHISYHGPTQQPPQHKHMKHHHSNRQSHSSHIRRCSIEISSKIPGICQSMGSVGNACISGDYIDMFNAKCS